MRETTWGVLLASLLAQACVTHAVLHRAQSSHDTTEIKEIRSARLLDRVLFVEVDVRRHGSDNIETLILPVPIDDLSWPESMGDQGFDRDGLRLHQVATLSLRPVSAQPSGGIPIQVEELTIESSFDLSRQESLGEGVHVVRLFHKPDSYHYPKGPYLAVFVNRAFPQWSSRTVVPGFSEGRRVKPSWYLVVPVAAVIDVATFPVQVLAAILTMDE